MKSRFADALRIIHALGEDAATLDEALSSVSIVYKKPEPQVVKNSTPEQTIPPKRTARQKVHQPALSKWRFPIIVPTIKKLPPAKGHKPLLTDILDREAYQVVKSQAKPNDIAPIPLWTEQELHCFIKNHWVQIQQGRKINTHRLTRSYARQEVITSIPRLNQTRLPSEVWLFADLRAERSIFSEDCEALANLITKIFGQTALGFAAYLKESEPVVKPETHSNWTWHPFEVFHKGYLHNGNDVPLPENNAICLIVTDAVQDQPWQGLIKQLQCRGVKHTLFPYQVPQNKKAVSHNKNRTNLSDKELLLTALSLTPRFFNLAMIRELRLALTDAKPALEYELFKMPSLYWFVGRDQGQWRQGFKPYHQKVKSLDTITANKVRAIINRHVKNQTNGVVNESLHLMLTFLQGWTEKEKQSVRQHLEQYFKSVAKRLYRNGTQKHCEWWLRRGLRLSAQSRELQPAFYEICTVAIKKWESTTGEKFDKSLVNPKLWYEMHDKTKKLTPGVLRLSGNRIYLERSDNAGTIRPIALARAGEYKIENTSKNYSTGIIVARLEDSEDVITPPFRGANQNWPIPKHKAEITFQSSKESVSLKAFNSRDFYWADSVTVTKNGVKAETKDVQAFWPHQGDKPTQVILKDSSESFSPELITKTLAAFYLDDHGLCVSLNLKGVTVIFRYIPPGSFLMGSPDNEPEHCGNEQQHVVSLTQGFWLGETAVTQALWQAVMGDNPSHFNESEVGQNTDQHPVEQVSWEDSQALISALNSQFDEPLLTLPTEAQWEYACRAGTTTPFSTGNQLTTDQANYDGNYPYDDGEKGRYRERTQPVKSFKPNAWGLYQMHGNVDEWCLDNLRDFSAEPIKNPVGALNGPEPVVRGGFWFSSAGRCRSANRDAGGRDFRYHFIGLRLAMVSPTSKS